MLVAQRPKQPRSLRELGRAPGAEDGASGGEEVLEERILADNAAQTCFEDSERPMEYVLGGRNRRQRVLTRPHRSVWRGGWAGDGPRAAAAHAVEVPACLGYGRGARGDDAGLSARVGHVARPAAEFGEEVRRLCGGSAAGPEGLLGAGGVRPSDLRSGILQRGQRTRFVRRRTPAVKGGL